MKKNTDAFPSGSIDDIATAAVTLSDIRAMKEVLRLISRRWKVSIYSISPFPDIDQRRLALAYWAGVARDVQPIISLTRTNDAYVVTHWDIPEFLALGAFSTFPFVSREGAVGKISELARQATAAPRTRPEPLSVA